MELQEVKQFLNDNKDNEEVSAYLKELKTVSKDDVEDFLETSEGKKLLQPKLDKNFNTGLETWKKNNLDALVEEKYNKKHPEETEEQKRIRQLEEKLSNSEKEKQREVLVRKAADLADEKGLPKKIVDRFVGEDEETTVTNITEFETALNEWAKGQKKLGGREPHPSNPNKQPQKVTKEQFEKMGYSERAKLYNDDPDVYKQLIN